MTKTYYIEMRKPIKDSDRCKSFYYTYIPDGGQRVGAQGWSTRLALATYFNTPEEALAAIKKRLTDDFRASGDLIGVAVKME